jgi:hypothetical protein
MSNHGANVVRITALCADLRDLTAASLLETKELEEVITRCMEIQKEAFHLQEWAMTCPRFRVCQVGRVKEAQARTIDGLGTVAVLLLLFVGLMFL